MQLFEKLNIFGKLSKPHGPALPSRHANRSDSPVIALGTPRLFKNLSIAKKLFVLISVAAFFVATVAVTGYYFLAETDTAMQNLSRQELRAVKLIDEAQIEMRAAQAVVLEYLLVRDADRRQALQGDVKARGDKFTHNLSELEKTALSDDQRRNLDLLNQMLKGYRENRDLSMKLVGEGKSEQAVLIYTYQCIPVLDGVNKQLGYIAQEFNDKAADAYAESSRNVAAASMSLTVIGLFALLVVIGLGLAIARMVSGPLKEVAATVTEVANGNLAANRISVDSHDESGQVASAINAMAENLRSLIRQVAGSAEQVAAASEQLTASADQAALTASQIAQSITGVAQGSSAQLQAVENSSAAVEQLSSTVRQVTANAGIVADTSAHAAAAAEQGAKQISSAVRQFATIEKTVAESARIVHTLGDRSKEIGQIIDTISSIAGQTNLLALNAAIESARAGDAGRGFAVVAEEVRKLAEQSQDASKQIGSLIGAIQTDTDSAVAAMRQGTREVKAGSDVVNGAGEAFEKILNLVGQVSNQAQEMSLAISRMAAGSQQIVTAMKDIDTVSKSTAAETQTVSASTEQQSATMEEIAASSQGLAKLAQDMQTAMLRFRL